MDKTIQSHGDGTVTGRWPRRDGRVTNTVYAKQYMVIVGTLGQGFEFYGPFDTVAKAAEWAGDNLHTGVYVNVEEFHNVRDDA